MTGREGFRKCSCGGWGWNRRRSRGRRTSPAPLCAAVTCLISLLPGAPAGLQVTGENNLSTFLPSSLVRVWEAGTRDHLPSVSACSAKASLNGTTSPPSWGTRGRESGKYCPCHPAGVHCSVPRLPGVLVPASLALQDHLAASLSSKQPRAPPGPQTIPFLIQSVQGVTTPPSHDLSLSVAERGRRGKQRLSPELRAR